MFQKLKVLELAAVLAGPSVGQFFAELGAEVIKVENIHTRGDVTRTWRVEGENTDDRSSYFCAVNWGKKSIAIDLNSNEGRDIVYKLVRQADILIASYKAGDAEKFGVDFKTISSINSKIVYGQITGFGPDNSRVGYDAVIQAEAGFMFMNGEPHGNSLKMPVALMDILAAHHLKEGLLLALLRRHETGKGDLVHVSLLQSAIASLANQASNWLVAGVIPQKQGSAHPNIAPYGDLFKTSDGHEILLAIGSDAQFAALCDILKISREESRQYGSNPLRVKNRLELNHLLTGRIRTFALAEFTEPLNRGNIPYGLVKNVKEVFEAPEAQQLLLRSADLKGVKTFIASPFQNISSHFLPPPHYGEHSSEILIQSLEMSKMEVESLVKRGIIA
jgi:crotonobetainyl-CoA:carnitine CoA-transferase CaiB-like acyl-CoA transferase